MQRKIFVRATYMAFVLQSAVLVGLVGAVLFMTVTGLSLTAHPANRMIFILFIVILLFSFLVGWSCGGWAWSRIAKRFFGVTREEMKALLIGSNFKIGYLERANQRAIDKLYGTNEKG